jgi:hypothetical protein
MVERNGVKFVSRAMGLKMIGRDPEGSRLRNYEIESRLEDDFDGVWCISEWCPFNGRFCRLSKHVPHPHPPMVGEKPRPPETAIPWNDFVEAT